MFEFFPGDVVKVVKTLYAHYGVVAHGGLILELSGDRAKDIATASVRLSAPENFSSGGTIEFVYRPSATELEGFFDRLAQALGRKGYSLTAANCEHMAWWVATGRWRSTQVTTAAVVAGAALLWHLLPEGEEE